MTESEQHIWLIFLIVLIGAALLVIAVVVSTKVGANLHRARQEFRTLQELWIKTDRLNKDAAEAAKKQGKPLKAATDSPYKDWLESQSPTRSLRSLILKVIVRRGRV